MTEWRSIPWMRIMFQTHSGGVEELKLCGM
jgi:hypothetical protein